MKLKWNIDDKPASAKAVARDVADLAKMIFDKDGYHIPIIIILMEDGDEEIVNTIEMNEMLGDNWKRAAAETLSSMAKKVPEMYAVIFVCEAWSYKAKGANDHTASQLQDGEMTVSQLEPEDRQEILSVTVTTRDNDGLAVIYPINRDSEGVATLGEAESQDGPTQGRFGSGIWS